MKKCAWVLAILMVMALSVDAYAAPKFAVGARAGGNFYKDGGMDVSWVGFGNIGKVDYENKTAFMYGVNGTVQFNDYFSIELGVDRINSTQSDFKIGAASYKAGEITQTPITMTARLHYPVGIFSPYIGAGAGYYFRSYDKDNAFWNPAVTVDIDNGWGYHVNTGTEIFLTPSRNLALNLDFKYVWTKADLKATNGATSLTGSMDLNSFVAGIGIKYYF